jgi:hypothetical protein
MPRRSVDSVLPLTVTPAPAAITRVFVGRVEVMSAWVRRTLTTALANGDIATLAKYGRFVDAFASRIPASKTHPVTAAFFNSRYEEARHERDTPSCIR